MLRLWTSGVESWRQLAARGFWVEGCGDHLGFEDIRSTLDCPVLGLPPLRDWTAVTSKRGGTGLARLRYRPRARDLRHPAAGRWRRPARASKHDAARATHFYWSNAEQFHALRAVLPAQCTPRLRCRQDAQRRCMPPASMRSPFRTDTSGSDGCHDPAVAIATTATSAN